MRVPLEELTILEKLSSIFGLIIVTLVLLGTALICILGIRTQKGNLNDLFEFAIEKIPDLLELFVSIDVNITICEGNCKDFLNTTFVILQQKVENISNYIPCLSEICVNITQCNCLETINFMTEEILTCRCENQTDPLLEEINNLKLELISNSSYKEYLGEQNVTIDIEVDCIVYIEMWAGGGGGGCGLYGDRGGGGAGGVFHDFPMEIKTGGFIELEIGRGGEGCIGNDSAQTLSENGGYSRFRYTSPSLDVTEFTVFGGGGAKDNDSGRGGSNGTPTLWNVGGTGIYGAPDPIDLGSRDFSYGGKYWSTGGSGGETISGGRCLGKSSPGAGGDVWNIANTTSTGGGAAGWNGNGGDAVPLGPVLKNHLAIKAYDIYSRDLFSGEDADLNSGAGGGAGGGNPFFTNGIGEGNTVKGGRGGDGGARFIFVEEYLF